MPYDAVHMNVKLSMYKVSHVVCYDLDVTIFKENAFMKPANLFLYKYATAQHEEVEHGFLTHI